jgi:hypothetical protein
MVMGSFEIGFSSTGPEMEAMLARFRSASTSAPRFRTGTGGWIGELLLD